MKLSQAHRAAMRAAAGREWLLGYGGETLGYVRFVPEVPLLANNGESHAEFCRRIDARQAARDRSRVRTP